MEYMGFTGEYEWDDEGFFHGRVVSHQGMPIRDVITFEGSTIQELEEEFRLSVDDYLDFCNERDHK